MDTRAKRRPRGSVKRSPGVRHGVPYDVWLVGATPTCSKIALLYRVTPGYAEGG